MGKRASERDNDANIEAFERACFFFLNRNNSDLVGLERQCGILRH